MLQQFIELPENCINTNSGGVINLNTVTFFLAPDRTSQEVRFYHVHKEDKTIVRFSTTEEALAWYNEIKSQLNIVNNSQNAF